MPKHTVEQGEYLSKIATKYGFADYQVIWNHGENAKLKKKRENPNVLAPGDIVFIPEKGEKEETRATEKKHRFKAKKKPLMLRLVVKDADDRPVPNTKCQLFVEAQTHDLTTDGNGKIEAVIETTAETGKLIVKDEKIPIDLDVPIKIGHLDPIDEISGQKARLNNLGYNAGDPGGTANDLPFRSAVEEFQCDQKLKVDGICGSKTQSKLKDVHGC